MSVASSPSLSAGYDPTGVYHYDGHILPPLPPLTSESPYRFPADNGEANSSRARSGNSEGSRLYYPRDGATAATGIPAIGAPPLSIYSKLLNNQLLHTDGNNFNLGKVDPNQLLQALELNPQWTAISQRGKPTSLLSLAAIGWCFPRAEDALLDVGASSNGEYRHRHLEDGEGGGLQKVLCGLVLTASSMFVVDFTSPSIADQSFRLTTSASPVGVAGAPNLAASPEIASNSPSYDRKVSSPMMHVSRDPLAETSIPRGIKSAGTTNNSAAVSPSIDPASSSRPQIDSTLAGSPVASLPQCRIVSEVPLEALRTVSVLANTAGDLQAVQPPASPVMNNSGMQMQLSSESVPDTPFIALEIYGTSDSEAVRAKPLLTFVPLSTQALDNTPEFEIVYEFCIIPNVRVEFKVLDEDLISGRMAEEEEDVDWELKYQDLSTSEGYNVQERSAQREATASPTHSIAYSPNPVHLFSPDVRSQSFVSGVGTFSNVPSPSLSAARLNRKSRSGRNFFDHYHRSFLNTSSQAPDGREPSAPSHVSNNNASGPPSPKHVLAPFYGGRSFSLVAQSLAQAGIGEERKTTASSSNDLLFLQLTEQANRSANCETEGARRLMITSAFWAIQSKITAARFQKDVQSIKDTHTSLFTRQQRNRNNAQNGLGETLSIASLAAADTDKVTEAQLVAAGVFQKPFNADVSALIDLHEKQVRQRMGKYFTATREQTLTKARDLEWSIFSAAHKEQLVTLSRDISAAKKSNAKSAEAVAAFKAQTKELEEAIDSYKAREESVLERSRKREEALYAELEKEKAEKAKLLQKVRQLQLLHGKGAATPPAQQASLEGGWLDPTFEEVTVAADEEAPLRRKYSMFSR